MGIDYDARLVFGWQVDFKTIETFAQKHDLEIYDIEHEVKIHFPGIYLVGANPYYDCGINKNIYYISLLEKYNKPVSLEDINKVSSENYEKTVAFMKNELEIEVSTPPVLQALPHIW